jgi:hypothetical protein
MDLTSFPYPVPALKRFNIKNKGIESSLLGIKLFLFSILIPKA